MTKLNRDLKIVLLMGGPGAERQVSLVSGNAVMQALQSAGFTNLTAIDLKGADFSLPAGTELVYNLIHGTFGEDGALQSMLETLNVPFTGAGARSSRICFDKFSSKKRFIEAGVPTPEFQVVDTGKDLTVPPCTLPVVVKPAQEGSSVGVHIVREQHDLLHAVQEAGLHSPNVLIEEFIQGKELTVGIIDGKPLPIIQICPRSGFYDLNNKYPWMNTGGGTDYICPAQLPPELAKNIQQIALDAYNAAEVEVYARVDVLLRESDNQPFVLEINTIPGMTPSSLLPKAAAADGIPYEKLCELIAQISLNTPRD